MALNINQKIEAKKSMSLLTGGFPYILAFGTRSQNLKTVYRVWERGAFTLPYEVQKLSKKARRNNLN